jgi:Zn-finger nucleic acid-binding protein
MLILELEGIELDHCPACGGTWLDAGELETIAERAGARPGRLAALLAASKLGAKSRRRCPRCRARLREATVAVGGGKGSGGEIGDGGEGDGGEGVKSGKSGDRDGRAVQIDRCPHGDGLWFDRGELRQLVEAATGADEAEHQAIARFFADALGGTIM